MIFDIRNRLIPSDHLNEFGARRPWKVVGLQSLSRLLTQSAKAQILSIKIDSTPSYGCGEVLEMFRARGRYAPDGRLGTRERP